MEVVLKDGVSLMARFPFWVNRWLCVLLVCLALLCLGSTCLTDTGTSSLPSPDRNTLVLLDSDPATLDPALARETGSVGYIVQIFSGLVAFDQDMNLVGDIAERWETDTSGTAYTFHIRQNACFHDGRSITSADFKYSWERACNPATGSETAATYLNDIVGAREMLAGQAQELAGVETPDDYTLRITIDSPKAYFLPKLAQPVSFVVDKDDVGRGADWWRSPNGSGPFGLATWKQGELLELERNGLYYREQARVARVAFLISQGYDMQLYERGAIDVAGVSIYDLERVTDPENSLHSQLSIFNEYSITYLGFNMDRAPFNDSRVRRAFSQAVDKERVISQVLLDSVEMAAGIIPSGMEGHDPAYSGLVFDPGAAAGLLASAGYGPGGTPLKVVATLPGNSGEVAAYLGAVLYQWEVNLGVEVEIRQLDSDAYFDRLNEEKDDVFFFGWSADYPDPQDFLEVLFRSGVTNNAGGYIDQAYDALLDQAAAEQDPGLRTALYRQAENKLISEDAACLPLWFGRSYVLVKPRVTGFELSPLGYPLLANVSLAY